MSLKLKELPYEIDGRELTLRCNMSVLADLQDSGDLLKVLDDDHSFRNFLVLLSTLVNEALREGGSADYYSPDDLGARLSYADFKRDSGPVFELLIHALVPERDETAAEEPEPSEKPENDPEKKS